MARRGRPTGAARRARLRMLRRVGMVAVVLVLAVALVLWLMQDRFVYLPSDDTFPVDPAAAGIIDVPYTTSDGLELHGLLVPSRQPTPPCGTTPVALVFHGQGGNKTWGYPLALALAAHGTTVFLAEYRGFGGAPGRPSEEGLTLDARAALAAVRARAEVDPARIVYVGVSLGTGVAARLAADDRPAGLVLLAPYTSLPDAAATRLPGLPYRWLMRDHFDTIGVIGAVQAPTLVVLGTADETVPVEQSRAVYASAGHPDGLVEVEGLGHGAVEIHAGDAAIEPVSGAISRWTACPPA